MEHVYALLTRFLRRINIEVYQNSVMETLCMHLHVMHDRILYGAIQTIQCF